MRPRSTLLASLVLALTTLALLAPALSTVAHAADEAGPPKPDDTEASTSRGIPWAESFEKATESAKETKRPILVDFGAEWCGWCKKLDRETFSDARVIRLVREFFVAVKVDTDVRKDLATRFQVKGLPTILVISPDGKVLQSLSGFRPPEVFVEEIGKAAQSASSLEELRKEAEARPEDVDVQRAYARAIYAAGSAAEAAKVLEGLLEKRPDDALVLLELADMLRVEQRSKEARALYAKVLALPSETAGEAAEKACLPLARLQIGAREIDAALTTLERFVEKHPESEQRAEGLFLRAYVHSIRDDADKAVADLRAVIDLAPESRLAIQAGTILDTVERTR